MSTVEKMAKIAKKNLPSTKKEKLSWAKKISEESIHYVDDKPIIYPAVYETTDYEKLEYFIWNRKVLASHVTKMGNSVITTGAVLRDAIIINVLDKKKFFIGDAQHLINAMTNLSANKTKLPIRFKLISTKNEKEALKIVGLLNSSSRGWSSNQFLTSSGAFYKDYARLLEYKTEYGFQNYILAMILMRINPCEARLVIRNSGLKIRISDREAKRRLDSIRNLFSKTELLSDAYCIVGLIQFIEKVGMEKFYSHEKEFVQSVIDRLERSDLKGNTYGKSSSYVDFFNKCWCGE